VFLSATLLALLPAAAPLSTHATALAPAADGKLLFVALASQAGREPATGFVCVWDLTKPELKAVIPGVPADVHVIRPTADGKRFVVVCGDLYRVTAVKVWDAEAKKQLRSFELPNDRRSAAAAAVSPDGKWVVLRPLYEKELLVSVWNAETGERAVEVEAAAKGIAGMPAFSADSKKLILASLNEFTEFDLATGKKAGGWKREKPARPAFLEGGGRLAVLPDGKGAVSVAPTGKRRQSYVVRVVTEKKDWFVGEFWDFATAPALSPDGRLLIVSGGARPDAPKTFALKLDADGAPGLEEKTDKQTGPWYPQLEKKVPAWREWPLTTELPAGWTWPARELPGPLAFAPDGKRLFVCGPAGAVRVFDVERRVPKANLFVGELKKDELPEWHIATAAGEVVGSPGELESLTKAGKVKDAAKVKESLGVK
jgi:hypothetical protein